MHRHVRRRPTPISHTRMDMDGCPATTVLTCLLLYSFIIKSSCYLVDVCYLSLDHFRKLCKTHDTLFIHRYLCLNRCISYMFEALQEIVVLLGQKLYLNPSQCSSLWFSVKYIFFSTFAFVFWAIFKASPGIYFLSSYSHHRHHGKAKQCSLI